MKILLIEDDLKTAQFVQKGLEEAGYSVISAADGQEGLAMAGSETFDLAIVDVMLPLVDGFTIIEKMRANAVNAPVIVLSARSSVDDKVRGLYAGGDIYMVKPFSFTELLANIQAQLRRSCIGTEPTLLRAGDLSIDLIRRKVTRAGKPIELQPKEFQLLEYLVRNRTRVVTKTMIMEHVWNYNFDPKTNIVEARIYKLREKIDKGFDTELIRTVHGVGYVIE
ncbi:MAG: response regulator transcription factor [Victivallaceae bacterium]|nr:response regulator transcription factor [Victivallaceae bacterium]